MQIVNGQPTFGTSDAIAKHDDTYAYDSQGNIMGRYNSSLGTSGSDDTNPLNTTMSSFLDYLKANNGAGISTDLNSNTVQQGDHRITTKTLGDTAASAWGNDASNPYANWLLNYLTNGQTQTTQTVAQQSEHQGRSDRDAGSGLSNYSSTAAAVFGNTGKSYAV